MIIKILENVQSEWDYNLLVFHSPVSNSMEILFNFGELSELHENIVNFKLLHIIFKNS